MKIGLIKDRKHDENRVALQPNHVKELVSRGHEVFVEFGAGVNSGYADEMYEEKGAKLVEKQTLLNSCKLLLKVKAPLDFEYSDYKSDHILFTYLHFDENIAPEKIMQFIEPGFLGIAYEWVEVNNDYPLLRPMSKLTGYLFAQKSLEFLARHKGKLAGAYEGYINPAKAMIIGLGTIGMSALKYYLDNNVSVVIVDKNPSTIEERVANRFGSDFLKKVIDSKYEVIKFDSKDVEKTIYQINNYIPSLDILLNCAVRRPDLPKSQLEYIVTEEMVKKMIPGSVIADTTGCDKDLIETCISSESLEEYDLIHGIVHYNCDHIPSLVGKTATDLLTSQTFKYVLELADKGEKAILNNDALRKGASCFKGNVTHEYSASKKKLPYVEITSLIQ
jgi:alanine dehydrogenase